MPNFESISFEITELSCTRSTFGERDRRKIQQQLVFKFYISELQNYLQFRYLYTRAFVIQN